MQQGKENIKFHTSNLLI